MAWVGKIAVDVALLAKGSWTRALRWGFAAVQVFTIGVLAAMLFGAPIIDLSSVSAIPGMSDLQDLPFGGGIYFTVRFILLIIIGSIAWDTIKVLKPEFKRNRCLWLSKNERPERGVFDSSICHWRDAACCVSAIRCTGYPFLQTASRSAR